MAKKQTTVPKTKKPHKASKESKRALFGKFSVDPKKDAAKRLAEIVVSQDVDPGDCFGGGGLPVGSVRKPHQGNYEIIQPPDEDEEERRLRAMNGQAGSRLAFAQGK